MAGNIYPLQMKHDFLEALRLGFSFGEALELSNCSIAQITMFRKYDKALDEEVTRIMQGRPS